MAISTLNLYNCVPGVGVGESESPIFLSDHGVMVAPSAEHELQSIKDWLSKKALNGEQVNSSFHKSWEKN